QRHKVSFHRLPPTKHDIEKAKFFSFGTRGSMCATTCKERPEAPKVALLSDSLPPGTLKGRRSSGAQSGGAAARGILDRRAGESLTHRYSGRHIRTEAPLQFSFPASGTHGYSGRQSRRSVQTR